MVIDYVSQMRMEKSIESVLSNIDSAGSWGEVDGYVIDACMKYNFDSGLVFTPVYSEKNFETTKKRKKNLPSYKERILKEIRPYLK